MRIKGKEVKEANIETIVIPRGNDPEDFIIFKAQAVLDYDEFNALCPFPVAPTRLEKGGKKVADTTSTTYQVAKDEHARRRFAWTVLKSLEATEDLQWDKVNMNDPNTWENYEEEMRQAKFSVQEMNLILEGVLNANCLNNEKLDEARKSFLASLETEPSDQ